MFSFIIQVFVPMFLLVVNALTPFTPPAAPVNFGNSPTTVATTTGAPTTQSAPICATTSWGAYLATDAALAGQGCVYVPTGDELADILAMGPRNSGIEVRPDGRVEFTDGDARRLVSLSLPESQEALHVLRGEWLLGDQWMSGPQGRIPSILTGARLRVIGSRWTLDWDMGHINVERCTEIFPGVPGAANICAQECAFPEGVYEQGHLQIFVEATDGLFILNEGNPDDPSDDVIGPNPDTNLFLVFVPTGSGRVNFQCGIGASTGLGNVPLLSLQPITLVDVWESNQLWRLTQSWWSWLTPSNDLVLTSLKQPNGILSWITLERN